MDTSETLAEVCRDVFGIVRVVRRFTPEVAGDLVRLEFEATDEGVVERGGNESLRPRPRFAAEVGVFETAPTNTDNEVLECEEFDELDPKEAAVGGFVGFSLGFSAGSALAGRPPLCLEPLVRFSAIRSRGTHSSYRLFQPV